MLCILCFVFGILYCSFNLAFHLIITFAVDIHCKYRSWTLFLLLSQRICLYCFYIQRIKVTFEHSLLRIKRVHIQILYILTCLSMSIATFFAYYYHTSHECTDQIQKVAILPALLLDVFWCLFLSIWFVRKLQQTIIEFQTDGNQIDESMVLLMCKLTNITVWGSFLLQIGQWIFGFFSGWIISAVTLNVLITSIALLFTFRSYSKLYESYICCFCHQFIIKYWKIRVEDRIRHSISDKFKVKKERSRYDIVIDESKNDETKEIPKTKIERFHSEETLEVIEEIVNKYDDQEKVEALNYWFIARKIGRYFEKMFADKNTVVIVSRKGIIPQISDCHLSVKKFDRTFENINGKYIRIYRTIGHRKLNGKYQRNEIPSFQQIVFQLSMEYDDVNKIAEELNAIYGSGCHVVKANDYAYSYNLYCNFNDGLIARAVSDSSFVIAWRT